RRLVEEQVRLVEEEHELRLLRVAGLGQVLEQLRQQPKEQRRIQPRRIEQLVGGEDVDRAFAAGRLHQVLEREHRLAEELRRALVLEREKPALDRADRAGGDVAV